MKKYLPARAMLAATLVSALMLSGCSNSESDSTAEKTSAAANAANTSQAPTPLAANSNAAASAKLPTTFDLQAHRGGRGEWTENSRTSFENVKNVGVTTIELDILVSEDGVPVVWHDEDIQAEKCADTAPATPQDPEFPYVGKLIKDLSWAQLQTLDCNKALEKFPEAKHEQGTKLIQLSELYDIYAGTDAYFNVEAKVAVEKPGTNKPNPEIVSAMLGAINASGMADRTTIQSFDWSIFPLFREQAPEIPLALLWDETTWKSGSAWTGSVDYDAVKGDVIAAAKQLDVQILSPGFAVPYDAAAGDKDYHPVATPEFMRKAHEAGLRVIPWTINDEATMREQIDAGVDGIITDYPSKLKKILDEKGVEYK
ncbi:MULTISPECIES: glycerophosphodiester phosphodiesterase family protein [unclassified Corynebacterium]|uniref:glycerophosphodiester phosphodiesterase family protein n=1 Tax=unclassified Corynebacterium TaxID=2624378 RepID=UPI001FED2E45|nr:MULTISPECIES: glycerophosphodiester phosphodiesterase family protein [unclassified Corynebacterium]